MILRFGFLSAANLAFQDDAHGVRFYEIMGNNGSLPLFYKLFQRFVIKNSSSARSEHGHIITCSVDCVITTCFRKAPHFHQKSASFLPEKRLVSHRKVPHFHQKSASFLFGPILGSFGR